MPGKPALLTLAIAVWLSVVLSGFAIQARYASTPGAHAIAPVSWPVESRIRPTPDTTTVLVFLHPHCPCSRATLDQLQRTLAAATTPVEAHLIFVSPPGTERAWEQGPLLKQAQRIPDLAIRIDTAGREASLFGAATSGQILAYDPLNRLIYQGGITNTRGHEGDNPGARALRALLRAQPLTDSPSAPVFGCPLFDPERPIATNPSAHTLDGYCSAP